MPKIWKEALAREFVDLTGHRYPDSSLLDLEKAYMSGLEKGLFLASTWLKDEAIDEYGKDITSMGVSDWNAFSRFWAPFKLRHLADRNKD